MNGEESGFVEVHGQSIYYRVRGEGPPLVFVHGWTLDLGYWDAQTAYFSGKYRTYCYDWRGMGKSGGATPPFTMRQLGAELAGLIQAWGIEKPILCGHSEGGAIASQYAAEHPDSLSALILADTDINTLAEWIPGTVDLVLTEFFAYLEERKGLDPLAAMIPNLEKQFYSPDFVATHPGFIAAWRKQFLGNSLRGVLNGLRAWNWRTNLSRSLRNVKVPALLLWGTEDIMISLSQMQALQASLGGMTQLSALDGSGHMTPVEVPDRFNDVMEAFLAAHVSAESRLPDSRAFPPRVEGA